MPVEPAAVPHISDRVKIKVLLTAGLLFFGTLAASHAGGAVGVRWGGCGGGVVGVGWGGWGGWGCRPYWGPRYYCAPRPWGGWGWGWGAPVVGVRVVSPAPVVTTTYVTTPAPKVRSSPVTAAQQELAALGYYGGSVDGIFGPQTSAALQRYQRDYGLPSTGRLDRATRDSLGL
jgi:hypothetical protein